MLAGSKHAEDDFSAILADQHDLDPPIADDEQGIARIVLEQNDAAFRIALLARQLREALQLGVVELGEEWNCPQEVGDLHQSECSERELVGGAPNGRRVSSWYSLDGRRHRRRVTNKCAAVSRQNTLLAHPRCPRTGTLAEPSLCPLVFCAKSGVYYSAIFSSY